MANQTPFLKPTPDLPEPDAQVFDWMDEAEKNIRVYEAARPTLPEQLTKLKRLGEVRLDEELKAAAAARDKRRLSLKTRMAVKQRQLKDMSGLFRRPQPPATAEQHEFAIQNLADSLQRLQDGATAEDQAFRRHHKVENRQSTDRLKHEVEVQGWSTLIDELKTCQDGVLTADPVRVMRLEVFCG